MSDDIEVPRRGYDTEDVESLARTLEHPEQGGSRRGIILVVIAIAAAAGMYLLAGR